MSGKRREKGEGYLRETAAGTITDAINQKKKIQFKYTEYNADKEKVFRHDGEIRKIHLLPKFQQP